jgi:hypothetical protein
LIVAVVEVAVVKASVVKAPVVKAGAVVSQTLRSINVRSAPDVAAYLGYAAFHLLLDTRFPDG